MGAIHHDFWAATQNDPVAAFTGLLAIFTFALVAVSSVQILFLIRADRASKRALDQSRESSQKQLRAYIFLQEVTFDWDMPLNLWQAKFSYRNSGSTPAYDVKVSSALFIREIGGADPAWDDFNATYAVGLIGPNGDSLNDHAFFEGADPGSDGLRDKFAQGTHEVILSGRIDYVDEFGSKRWTSFRYTSGGAEGYPDPEMTACPQGNDADRTG